MSFIVHKTAPAYGSNVKLSKYVVFINNLCLNIDACNVLLLMVAVLWNEHENIRVKQDSSTFFSGLSVE